MDQAEITANDGRSIDDLIEIVQKNREESDAEMIRRAFEFAKKAHGTGTRKSGDLYIVHPLGTALRLAELGLDDHTVTAGLLHDVPEDTDLELADVKKEFGKEVARLVEGITKLGQLKYRGIDRYVENLRRMFVAMANDVRVILIKFCDRIDNLETLQALPPEKRRRIALESLEIYAPIANRLGMGEIKGQLEDLSFPYVYPEEFQWMTRKVVPRFKEKEEFIKKFQQYVEKDFAERNIEFVSVHGRAKHLYSLYQKLIRYNRDISQIYDLVALRIIVDSVAKCYEALGVIHEICKPLKGRIKDYIAQPKPNGYQSLHTTVFAPQPLLKKGDEVHGEIIEIQIRTTAMHAEAEYGIAAHWKYKEEDRSKEKIDRVMDWMQEIVDVQKGISDTRQLLETLKIDFFQNYIFVFTPRGDIIELPEDSTPVDFAFKIHTDLGNQCTGAKVNDSIASLDTRLKSGDVVEIFTDPHRKGPSADWLEFVKTNTARSHIRSYINKKRRSLLKKTGFDL